jgi:multimeric flavodoxin WrbA
MRITVLNGSPKGDVSVTMQYVHFIARKFPRHEWDIVNVARQIGAVEKKDDRFRAVVEGLAASDLVLWAFPLYVCLVSSQYKRFIELLFERGAAARLAGKYSAALSTSVHFFDHTAHNYIQAISEDLGMLHVGGYSADMYELQKPENRRRIALFAEHTLRAAENRDPVERVHPPLPSSGFAYEPGPAGEKVSTAGMRVRILTDAAPGEGNLGRMIDRFRQSFREPVEVLDLRAVDIKGGCLGCCECGYDNTCAYDGKDGFADFYRDRVLGADILVFAGAIRDRYLSSTWKCYFDRAFFNTHIPTLAGRQVGFLVSGPLGRLPNLRQILEGYTEWQQANLAGIVTDEAENDAAIDAGLRMLAERSVRFARDGYVRPPGFLGVAGMKLLRDEVWGRLRFVFQADHRFYSSQGLYDFPQKDLKMRGANLVMGGLLKIPAFRREFRKRIKEEMIKPLQKVLRSGGEAADP